MAFPTVGLCISVTPCSVHVLQTRLLSVIIPHVEIVMAKPVLLTPGADPGTGAAVATKFAANTYRLASATRSLQHDLTDINRLELYADLSKSDTVSAISGKVKERLEVPNSRA
ncbi:hypothetical protein BAUCODRAFT_120377 [Baudoinia panamericana UAMH 10762]|uniref:Uncharacterized protein n=1 Tax=Baudoinia panamericana (strain UAMH 10762) TaxID=717646 RepID=M2NJ07_BAUPA|nr:uncharacterized protein BAUCODRAFT_120377 [Baudoinia panamericana UAMH 10762]EMC99085.1 hypothetical protein BAUCODRAFT_120377 [Baudoinia panamericana UAMH 10762]